jgi:hypothetical protein
MKMGQTTSTHQECIGNRRSNASECTESNDILPRQNAVQHAAVHCAHVIFSLYGHHPRALINLRYLSLDTFNATNGAFCASLPHMTQESNTKSAAANDGHASFELDRCCSICFRIWFEVIDVANEDEMNAAPVGT